MAHIDKKQKREKEEVEVKKTPHDPERERVLALIPSGHTSGKTYFSSDGWGPLGGAKVEDLLRAAEAKEDKDGYTAQSIIWCISGADALHIAKAEAATPNQEERLAGIRLLLQGVNIAKDLFPTIMAYVTPLPRVLILDVGNYHSRSARKGYQHTMVCTDEMSPHYILDVITWPIWQAAGPACVLCNPRPKHVMAVMYPGMQTFVSKVEADVESPLSRQPKAVATGDELTVATRDEWLKMRRWHPNLRKHYPRPNL